MASAAVIDAGTASFAYQYRAERGEHNRLSVSVSEREIVFSDAAAPIGLSGAVESCSQQTANRVSCVPGDGFGEDVEVLLGDGDDVARTSDPRGNSTFVWLYGGAGADELVGGDDRDLIYGGEGPDRLAGGQGDDSLDGEAGDDLVRGGRGSDELTGRSGRDDLGGGSGRDFVWYASTLRRPVKVTLDGRRNDGVPGEGDLVRRDVEGASGSGMLIGNSRPNQLSGFGRSEVRGGGGADDLVLSGPGRIHGGSGADSIRAAGKVLAYGGPGDDRLEKDEDVFESARFFGEAGDDTIDAVDISCPSDACFQEAVKDSVSCGPGRDTATLGALDVAARDCERVSRPG